MMRRLALFVALSASVTVLAACHGSDQFNSKWFYLTSSHCYGTSAMIRMGQPSWNTRLQGFTFRHTVPNNCEVPSDPSSANVLRAEGEFYEYNVSLCDLGPVNFNESGSPAAFVWFPNSCGNGRYYAATHAAAEISGTWYYGAVNSPVDAYCDGVNPGCP